MNALTEANADQPGPDRRKYPPKILCIDDDPDITTTILLRLSEFLVDVKQACHGMQGFAIAAQEKPDVIITDLKMPMGDGTLVLESLKRNSQTAHIPVIVLTGQRGEDLPGRMHRLGAVKFFRKPVPFEEMLHELSCHITLEKRYVETHRTIDFRAAGSRESSGRNCHFVKRGPHSLPVATNSKDFS